MAIRTTRELKEDYSHFEKRARRHLESCNEELCLVCKSYMDWLSELKKEIDDSEKTFWKEIEERDLKVVSKKNSYARKNH